MPPPEQSDAATANNPAWPKDPDVERRKAEAAMEKNRNVSDEREREQNPLRPDQLTPGGRRKKKQARTDDGYRAAGLRLRQPIAAVGARRHNSMFGNSMFAQEKGRARRQFTGEPPRSSLTDPPAGYQTPSPAQPYGLGKGVSSTKAYDDYYRSRRPE